MLILGLIMGFLYFKVDAVVRNMTCPRVTSRELDWKEMDGTWYLAAVATDLPIQGECAMVIFDHQDTLGVSIKWIANNTAGFYNGSVALIPDPNSNTTGDLLQVTYDDQKTETYSFLDIVYEHYAVVFACYNNIDGNTSTCKHLTTISPDEKRRCLPRSYLFTLDLKTSRLYRSGNKDEGNEFHSLVVRMINVEAAFEHEIWKMTRSIHLKDTDAAKMDQAIANYSLQSTSFISFNNTEDTCWVNSGSQVDTSTFVLTSAAALTLFRRMY